MPQALTAATVPESASWQNLGVTGEIQVLRNRGLYVLNRAVAVGALATCVVILIAGPTPEGQGGYLGAAATCLAWALASWQATRMRVELSDAGVTVYKFGSTAHVAWLNVSEVRADYGGLHIVRQDGAVVTAGSMGTSGLASKLDLGNRAEVWERLIRERAEAERQQHRSIGG
jgi:hypothetical protein